jgi:16S rRNA (cytosine1402-N4)-methyltransferase
MSASNDADLDRRHTPVLYQRVLSALNPCAGARYIDGTLGPGGHARGILEASAPDGQLLGIDVDPIALSQARQRLAPFEDRVHIQQGSYANMADYTASLGWNQVDGVLLDLGFSSLQVDDPKRGFSFRKEGPLDMRFDPSLSTTAADLVNQLPENELAELIASYGEENRARRVARAIVRNRPMQTTLELAEVVANAVGRTRKGIHPATRTFQALRMAVNEELATLENGLDQAVGLLAPGGRITVISFHSLEDRLVKRYFRRESRDCICPPEQPICTCEHRARLEIVTRRPIRPTEAEIKANPRARSARMRVAERLVMA